MLSLSDNQIALLQGPALALPLVLAAVPLGLAIDRYSRVRLLLLFAVFDVLGSVLTAFASDFGTLFLARCLIGLITTAVSTTAFSLLSDLYPSAQRGRASTAVVIGQFGGMSAAFALGGLLATPGSAVSDWRWAMGWLGAPLIPVVLLMLLMREPLRTVPAAERPSARQTRGALWQYRSTILPLAAGVVAAEFAVMAVLTWAASALSRSFTLAPDRIGAIMAVALVVSGIVGPLGGGILADLCQRKGGPRRTMWAVSSLVLLGVPAGLFSVVSDTAVASVLLIAFVTIMGAIVVSGTALFTIVVPSHVRGLSMALLAAACALFGVGLAPVTVSVLSGLLSGSNALGNALTWVCVASSLIGAGTFGLGAWLHPRGCGHSGLRGSR